MRLGSKMIKVLQNSFAVADGLIANAILYTIYNDKIERCDRKRVQTAAAAPESHIHGSGWPNKTRNVFPP